jgi:hypothetical protein
VAARNDITAYSRKNEAIHYKQNMGVMNDAPMKNNKQSKPWYLLTGFVGASSMTPKSPVNSNPASRESIIRSFAVKLCRLLAVFRFSLQFTAFSRKNEIVHFIF